jgi:uncharacterized protein YecE (DUF72 family)
VTITVGTSGWSYEHWDGVLYPHGLPAAARLGRYAEEFITVELNASFYRWPSPARFASWRAQLPPGFLMSAKAPRGLSHGRRLYGPEEWIGRIAAGWHELGERRGILLVQLAPDHTRDDERLDYFLRHVPTWIKVSVELRHPSWHVEEVFALLERRGAAYCVMSGAGLPCVLRATAPVVYLRMHGPDRANLYGGSYSDTDLGWWADRLREWDAGGHDVLVYFNNDGEGNAVRNARTLRRMLAG